MQSPKKLLLLQSFSQICFEPLGTNPVSLTCIIQVALFSGRNSCNSALSSN